MDRLGAPSSASVSDEQGVRLSCSFRASSLRQAVKLAADLRASDVGVELVAAARTHARERRDWIVSSTTPPLAMTTAAIQLWEDQMIALALRSCGCAFLGWRICATPARTVVCRGGVPDDRHASASRAPSQRELVVASLLRRPSGARRGAMHGRRVPKPTPPTA
jgi:hypothetical protein